jgi:hypothetical protein
MLKVGSTVIRNNGKATVVGFGSEGKVIVQFAADAKKGLNRCYMYREDEVKEVPDMRISNGDKFIFPRDTFIVADYYRLGETDFKANEYFMLISIFTGNKMFTERASRDTTEERLDNHFNGRQWTYVPRGETI